MSFPQQEYPNFKNFSEVSFPQEVTPPSVEPDEDMKCVRYNPAWSAVLAAACDQLLQFRSWLGTDDEKKLAVNRATNLKILLQQFEECDMGCCNPTVPTMTRVDPENPFNPQISYDGGVTWITNPNAPSLTTPALPPPVTSGVSSTKCDAASNALAKLKDLVTKQEDENTSGATIIEATLALVGALIGILLAPEVSIPVCVPIMIGAVSTIFALGNTAFSDYWTSDVYDTILCALFCHIEPDGSYTGSDFTAVISDLTANMPASPAKDWMISLIQVSGAAGLNTMAAYGEAADSDCSACDCGTCETANWDIFVNGTIVSVTDTTIVANAVLNSGHYYIDLSSHVPDFNADTHFSDKCCGWDWTTSNSTTITDGEIHDVSCGGSYSENFEGGASGIQSGTYDSVWFMEWKSSTPFQITLTAH